MNKATNLTEGKITSKLIQLALPIMGTSFIQMAYSLTDTMWVGRFSTEAAAAAGAISTLVWFGAGLVQISQIGVGVGVAQSYGKNDMNTVKKYISHGFQLDIFIAILYSLFLLVFKHQIVDFFNLNSVEVIEMAESYLEIMSVGFIFYFINPIFSASMNSSGNSMMPFKMNAFGLIINMILDPILIFGIGPISTLGIRGAAFATITAQIIVTIVFIVIGKKNETIYSHVNLFLKPDFEYIMKIVRLGFPPFVQTAIHSVISMIITRFVAGFGDVAVAVQTIGSQIESITWMSAEGFSYALSAFVGQNYGGRKPDRIQKGYIKGMQIIGSIGVFSTLLLVFSAKYLFSIFTPNDPVAIVEGIKYLRILGLSQFFMAIEIGTAGAFNGLGKTLPPTIIGVVLNIMRIPLALLLSSTSLGLTGIWWSISISSIAKGVVSPCIYSYVLKYKLENLIQSS